MFLHGSWDHILGNMLFLGPQGVDKSRLALEAMRMLQREVPDDVSLVDLARAGNAEDVARVVAQALGDAGTCRRRIRSSVRLRPFVTPTRTRS